jgi:DNA-3-methyladenine glycosylase
LPRAFFARDPLAVARDLLGCVVTARGVSVRLTEVEAYAGPSDPASHAYRGPTRRTEVMFGRPGHLYVYFVYGMHWCANLVCQPDGTAGAVLLRAGEVVGGESLARQRRPAARTHPDLARGPAKLAGVLALTGPDTGTDLCAPGSPIRVRPGAPVPDAAVSHGPRVGVAVAAEWPWRLWLGGDPTVSPYRAAVRRVRATRDTG